MTAYYIISFTYHIYEKLFDNFVYLIFFYAVLIFDILKLNDRI